MRTTHDDSAALTGAWELPEEFVALRDSVRAFVREQVRPREERLLPEGALPAEEMADLQTTARASGLWALQTPERLGGAGLSVLGQVVVAEEAAKCRTGAFFPAGGAFGGNPPSVLFGAPSAQFERWGRPIVEGRMPKAFTALSEASGGSDPARAIQCRADRDADDYVLNGTKMWTTHAGTAAWGVVYARTGEPGRRDGISAFVVETDTPGLERTPIEVMSSYSPYELRFTDARIPADQRIGAEGEGFALAGEFLTHGRIVYGAGPIGIAQHALSLAVDWVKQRAVFGSTLADKQAVQFMLADSEIELRAARLLVYQAAWQADLGRDVRVDASAAKVFATETAFRVLDRCVQLFGAMGLAREMPLERWFRDLRVKRLGEGASEVQRMVVARSLLR